MVCYDEADELSLCYRISSSLNLLCSDLNKNLFSPSNKVQYMFFLQPSGLWYSVFIYCNAFVSIFYPVVKWTREPLLMRQWPALCFCWIHWNRQENQLIGNRKTARLDLVQIKLRWILKAFILNAAVKQKKSMKLWETEIVLCANLGGFFFAQAKTWIRIEMSLYAMLNSLNVTGVQ